MLHTVGFNGIILRSDLKELLRLIQMQATLIILENYLLEINKSTAFKVNIFEK